MNTTLLVLYCAQCDYFVKCAVEPGTIGSHWCMQCDQSMEVYIAQGSREVVRWHDVPIDLPSGHSVHGDLALSDADQETTR